MKRPKICLTLSGKSIQEDLEILEKYRKYIDIVELRADFLEGDESLYVRRFPGLAGLPCILTFRRKIDGGQFDEGESSRTILFARALSFADTDDKSKNFEYVDFEEDFHIPSLQDAALAFGTKIIRSVHDMKNPIKNINQRLEKLKTNYFEIPKIAFMPHNLNDVTELFEEATKIKDSNHILLAMGPYGTPSRILSYKLKNYLTYSSPSDCTEKISNLAHIDPITLNSVYHYKTLNHETKIFGITGYPLKSTLSPQLHSEGYQKHKMNAVYIPIVADKVGDALHFAESVGVAGLSVTIPHKESVIPYLAKKTPEVSKIGACNTIVRNGTYWHGYNTDAPGFSKALLEFLGEKNLKHKKVAIIGAGGAAKAIAYAVFTLGAKACVFNRTVIRAKQLAELYGFKYASLDLTCLEMLKKYNDVIIQTTSKGMGSNQDSNEENDPLFFYDFTGKEKLFDIIYVPEVTPIMARAQKSGCKVCNGYNMLRYQGYEQFELYTGEKF